MAKAPKPESDNPDQSQRFVKTAKRLEADESGAVFDQALRTVKTSNSTQLRSTVEGGRTQKTQRQSD